MKCIFYRRSYLSVEDFENDRKIFEDQSGLEFMSIIFKDGHRH